MYLLRHWKLPENAEGESYQSKPLSPSAIGTR